MPYYAQLDGNNIVCAVSELSGVMTEPYLISIPTFDLSLMGSKYENGQFIPVPPSPPPSVITKVAMITRFTDQEFTGVLAAAKTDVEVEGWYARFSAASTINLDDSRTKAGMDMLVSKNLLTQARANEILTAPVQPSERPN